MACGDVGEPAVGPDEAFQVGQGLGDRRIAGCDLAGSQQSGDDQGRDARLALGGPTALGVLPGAEERDSTVDQLRRRGRVGRRALLAGSSTARARSGRPPSHASRPRVCAPWPRNRRRVVVADVMRSWSFLRGSALVGSITGRGRQAPEGRVRRPDPDPRDARVPRSHYNDATHCRPRGRRDRDVFVGWPSRPNWMTMSRQAAR